MAAESSAYKQLAGTSKLQLPGFFESLPKSNFKKVKVRIQRIIQLLRLSFVVEFRYPTYVQSEDWNPLQCISLCQKWSIPYYTIKWDLTNVSSQASYNLSQKLKGSDYANFPDGSGFCVRTKDGESIIAYKVPINNYWQLFTFINVTKSSDNESIMHNGLSFWLRTQINLLNCF